MIRNLGVEIKPAEPAIGKMEFDLLAQLALRTDSVAIADNEHADQQLGVDRGAANLATPASP